LNESTVTKLVDWTTSVRVRGTTKCHGPEPKTEGWSDLAKTILGYGRP